MLHLFLGVNMELVPLCSYNAPLRRLWSACGDFCPFRRTFEKTNTDFRVDPKGVSLWASVLHCGRVKGAPSPNCSHTEAQNCPKSFGKWRHYVFLSLKLRDPGQLQKNTPQRYLSSTKRYSWHSLSGNVLHSPNPDSSIRFVTSQNTFQ